jgi:DNA-binding NtrC family response regulator
MSGFADFEMAVEAMRYGAVDLLTKPLDDESLLRSIRRALEESELTRGARFSRWQAVRNTELPGVIGTSDAIRKIAAMVRRVAPTDVTVLIQGETGSGKELIAKAIHTLSRRSSGPYIAVNAGALPSNLLESTLFGVKKGAYTDATTDRQGLFEAANNGTIFLDEIGETAPDVQVRLLRAIEERAITRVGDTVSRPVNVRIVTATNRDMPAEVAAKRFREDLYYRIGTFRILLPPLRERAEDLEVLALHFVETYASVLNSTVKGISKSALEKLRQHHWPGNVRELDRVIQRAVILSDAEQLDPEAIETATSGRAGVEAILEQKFRSAESAFRRLYFERLLHRSGGNKTKAAELAGIDRTVLYAHLAKLDPPAED